jgi:hypothetical protein
MKIIHIHHDDAIDVVADMNIDPRTLPGDVIPSDRVMAGLQARTDAVEGVCSGCWAQRQMMNRDMRRKMFKGKKALFDGFVQHTAGCPAQDEVVRQWIYTHRRLV